MSAEEVAAHPGRYRPMRERVAAIDEAHCEAAEVFGEAQGWTISRRGSPRLLLSMRERRKLPRGIPAWASRDDVFEHPDFFVVAGRRRLVGAVVHLYRSLALDAVPDEIVVDQLDASWYMPGTHSYVLRSAAQTPQLSSIAPHLTLKPE